MADENEIARLFGERQRRLNDVIALRVPDRVPVVYFSMFWHAAYGGHTIREVMYDYDLAARLIMKAINDLQPDCVGSPFANSAIGPILDQVGYRQLRWPSHGTSDNSAYQYIDSELMKPDEYDLYLEDPTYFWLTRYLPRVGDAFAGLAKLPQFPSLEYMDLLLGVSIFADPEVVQSFAKLAEAGAESQRMLRLAGAHFGGIAAAGFPSTIAGMCMSPFDYFADFLRVPRASCWTCSAGKKSCSRPWNAPFPLLSAAPWRRASVSPATT